MTDFYLFIYLKKKKANKLEMLVFKQCCFHPRVQDGICDPAQSTATDQGTEIDLDEDEKDLDSKKVDSLNLTLYYQCKLLTLC